MEQMGESPVPFVQFLWIRVNGKRIAVLQGREALVQYAIPAVLTFIALLVAGIGSRHARRTRKPRLFKAGAWIAAAGLMLLWLLIWWAVEQDAGAWAMPLMVGALFVSISVLAGGIKAMQHAATGQVDTAADDALESLIRHNP
jgi:ABC-type transport system involved in cytochrome bd biosynthesis fused ATPase/permease subunit